MSSSPLLLLVLPALAAAVPLILWEPRTTWYQTTARLGAFGLALAMWIDLADNCGAACAEDDPVLLTACWALSAGLVAAGAVAAAAQLLARRRKRAQHAHPAPRPGRAERRGAGAESQSGT
jgi:hypothetical protein